MKKVYLPLLIVIALTTSCKKKYTCHCVTTNVGSTSATKLTETISALSSADALSQCNTDMRSYTQGGTFNCTIQ